MLTAEQTAITYKELVNECVERSTNGMDCTGCSYEIDCDDILKKVVYGSLHDR